MVNNRIMVKYVWRIYKMNIMLLCLMTFHNLMFYKKCKILYKYLQIGTLAQTIISIPTEDWKEICCHANNYHLRVMVHFCFPLTFILCYFFKDAIDTK